MTTQPDITFDQAAAEVERDCEIDRLTCNLVDQVGTASIQVGKAQGTIARLISSAVYDVEFEGSDGEDVIAELATAGCALRHVERIAIRRREILLAAEQAAAATDPTQGCGEDNHKVDDGKCVFCDYRPGTPKAARRLAPRTLTPDVLGSLLEACGRDDYLHEQVCEVARKAGLLWQCQQYPGGNFCGFDNRADEAGCGGCGADRPVPDTAGERQPGNEGTCGYPVDPSSADDVQCMLPPHSSDVPHAPDLLA